MKRLSFLLVTLAACGGTQQEEPIKPLGLGPSPAAPAKKSASGDVSFEIPAADLKGTVYEPEALGRPGMALVEAKRKTTIDKQRTQVQTTKEPIAKQAQAAILATMLYVESKTNKAQERALLTDARQVLRDVAQAVGDKNIDEITLRLLGTYELLLDDYAAAEKAFAGLIEKDPKAKDVPTSRTWLVYAQLKQFKNADALASVGPDKPDEKEPELAYITAWAKLRTGDPAGAWQAIAAAVKGWGQNAKRDELERDVLWFAGQSNIALDQAVPVVTLLAKVKTNGQPQRQQQAQYELLARLGISGYALAGHWAEGVVALDKAVEVAGDTVPVNDRPVIRYSQADYNVRLDAPDVAAKFAKQSLEALSACADKCTAKDKTDTIQGVYLMGRLFHILYATANDQRFYQPAHQLYDATIPVLDPAGRTQAQGDLKKLETTLRNTKVGTGTHDKGALGALLARHNQEVQTCYETALGSNPKLGGTVVVNLESDASGVVKGLSTEPKAGAADLSAVAKCAADRAKLWKLPKRGMAGSTRIKLSYNFAVNKK